MPRGIVPRRLPADLGAGADPASCPSNGGPRGRSSEDMSVAQRLFAARLRAGMTQRDLGAAIGVSHVAVHRYEAGHVRVSAGRLMRIAAALGIDAGYLLFGSEGVAVPPAAVAGGADVHRADAGLEEEIARLAALYRAIHGPARRAEVLSLAWSLACEVPPEYAAAKGGLGEGVGSSNGAPS